MFSACYRLVASLHCAYAISWGVEVVFLLPDATSGSGLGVRLVVSIVASVWVVVLSGVVVCGSCVQSSGGAWRRGPVGLRLSSLPASLSTPAFGDLPFPVGRALPWVLP
jgi:hypothetical protein